MRQLQAASFPGRDEAGYELTPVEQPGPGYVLIVLDTRSLLVRRALGAVVSMLGYRGTAELAGKPLQAVLPALAEGPDQPPRSLPYGKVTQTMAARADGARFPVEIYHCPCGSDAGASIVVVRDRTADVAADEEARRFRKIVEQTADSVMITDDTGVIQYVNPAFEATTGYAYPEIVGGTASVLKSGKHGPEFYAGLWKTLRGGRPFRAVFANRRRSGELIYEEKTITPVRDPDGRIRHFVSTAKDVTRRVLDEEQLAHLACHDALTGLPNRKLLQDRLEQAIAQARRNGTRFALLYLDLDGFKPINDVHGHDAGDTILRSIASRLAAAVRASDTVARLGGDEFIVVLASIEEAHDALAVAHKIIETACLPTLIRGSAAVVSCSVGLAMFPDDGSDPDALLRNADGAMYSAKRAGGSRCHRFAPARTPGTERRGVTRTPNRQAGRERR